MSLGIQPSHDWSKIAGTIVQNPETACQYLQVLLSPNPRDVEDPSYWWALARAAMHVPDASSIVNVYLRFVPSRSDTLLAYFSSLGMFFHLLRWKDVLAFYKKFNDRSAFWYFLSTYLAHRVDSRTYTLILENLENPALRPYLWKVVSKYVSGNGSRSPELLVALSRYADDFHYWRVLKHYLRRHPALASYILLRIPVRNRYFVLTALSLAKRFPRHLYPVIRDLARSGLRSKEFLAGLDSLKRKYPHIYGEI